MTKFELKIAADESIILFTSTMGVCGDNQTAGGSRLIVIPAIEKPIKKK